MPALDANFNKLCGVTNDNSSSVWYRGPSNAWSVALPNAGQMHKWWSIVFLVPFSWHFLSPFWSVSPILQANADIILRPMGISIVFLQSLLSSASRNFAYFRSTILHPGISFHPNLIYLAMPEGSVCKFPCRQQSPRRFAVYEPQLEWLCIAQRVTEPFP